jgi:hypothetical protein
MPGGEEPKKIDHDHRVRINLALSSGISSRTSPLPFIRFPEQKRSFTGYGKKNPPVINLTVTTGSMNMGCPIKGSFKDW